MPTHCSALAIIGQTLCRHGGFNTGHLSNARRLPNLLRQMAHIQLVLGNAFLKMVDFRLLIDRYNDDHPKPMQ